MRSFSDVIKDSPGVSDVHIAQAGRRPKRSRFPIAMIAQAPVAKADADVRIDIPITKVNDEMRIVYGWATVNAEDGTLVTDHQGDQISDHEMTLAAHDFMKNARIGGGLHALNAAGAPHSCGDVVESIVMTADVQKALGIDLKKTGWFIGYHVTDDDAWTLVKNKTLKAFSIGGKARRVPL